MLGLRSDVDIYIVHNSAGYKISELKYFAFVVSNSLWRLQGRCIDVAGS